MQPKDIAKVLAVDRFGIDAGNFETAWTLFGSASYPMPTGDNEHRGLGAALGITRDDEGDDVDNDVGDENDEVDGIMTIYLLATANMNLKADPSNDELLEALKPIARKIKNSEKALQEILQFIRSTKSGGVGQDVKVWFRKAGVLSGPTSIRSEHIEQYRRRMGDFEIFILDEDKYLSRKIGEVYVRGELVAFDDKNRSDGLSSGAYRLLVHLLKHEGEGGTSLDVAAAVWWYDGVYITEMKNAAKDHSERLTKSRNPFKNLDGRVKREKSALGEVLRLWLPSVELSVRADDGVSHHVLLRVPDFCLVERRTISM